MLKDKPLLLIGQTNVAPEGEDDFNNWFNEHIPHILKVPGYLWGQRYVAMRGDRKYLVVYQIENATYYDSLFGPDYSKRHPITLAEWEKWDRVLWRNTRISVYEQIYGTPIASSLLRSDRPLILEMIDVTVEKEPEWNQWYDNSHMPNLLKVPGYVMGGRFRIVESPVLANLQTKPKYLAIYELETEDVVPLVMDQDRMSPEAKAEFDNLEKYCRSVTTYLSRYAYRIISKHWKFEQSYPAL